MSRTPSNSDNKVVCIKLKNDSSKIMLIKLAELSGTSLSNFARMIIEDQYLAAVAESMNEKLKEIASTDLFGKNQEKRDEK